MTSTVCPKFQITKDILHGEGKKDEGCVTYRRQKKERNRKKQNL
jgi:hypothetical protein